MSEVFIVKAVRTPQAKSGAIIKDLPVPMLGIGLVRQILDEVSFPDTAVEEVIIGNTGAPAKYANVARVIALEAGLKKYVSAYTVHRNCASGMEAMAEGFLKIASGRHDIILAGGVESMSQMPLIFSKELTDLFLALTKARSVPEKLKVMSGFRLPYLNPVIAIEQGLTDPFCGLNMGQTAELLAREFGISREEQDEFANNSHMKAARATKEGRFKDEIVPLIYGDKLDKLLKEDFGPRDNSTVEGLAKMKPYFDRKSGTVTVGNSCPITDGGSMTLLVSAEALKKYNLKPMARIVDYHFHGLEPERMGLGPVWASHGVLKRANMKLSQMDLVELNEAFAAQVMACRKAMAEKKYATQIGLNEVLGEIPDDRLNVNGGAIALGHPVGSSGCRIVVTLAHELQKRKLKYGLATLCIGGGQGGAMIIENLN